MVSLPVHVPTLVSETDAIDLVPLPSKIPDRGVDIGRGLAKLLHVVVPGREMCIGQGENGMLLVVFLPQFKVGGLHLIGLE